MKDKPSEKQTDPQTKEEDKPELEDYKSRAGQKRDEAERSFRRRRLAA